MNTILNVTKNFIVALYDLFDDIMTSSSEVYEATYGGKGYTTEDMERVAMAMHQFGAVDANKVRGEIEARIENESSSAGKINQ